MRFKQKIKKLRKSSNGITLIALVVTIVVLLILAAISINLILGDNGIIQKAKDAQNKMEEAQNNELEGINKLSERIDSKTSKTRVRKEVSITDQSLRTTDRTETVITKDIKENQVVVPGEFKIADDSGNSVQQGIVIEDKDGNQFVWVPVSNTNGDGSNPIILDNGDKKEITLGRYKFKREKNTATNLYEDGTPTIIQKGSEYAETTAENIANGTVDTKYKAEDYYYELSDSRTSNESSGTDATNTTAKNLADFITKTNTNKGFYIARYEASYGSGYNSSGTTTEEKYGNAKPLSKPSTANSRYGMNYRIGTLWNSITQPQAAMVSQNMYKNNSCVESDLVNSYAWDTTIVYIQAMGNTNYANANIVKSLMNTGENGDEKCKIFDIAGNEFEWTTEYSIYAYSSNVRPLNYRGSKYNDSTYYASCRSHGLINNSFDYISFRTLLYVK